MQKKIWLMLALASCAVPSVFAFVTGTGFDQLTPGKNLDVTRGDDGSRASKRYWYSEITDVGVITNFSSLGSYDGVHDCGRPAQPAPNDRSFLVNAGRPVYRTANPYEPVPGGEEGFKALVPQPIGMGFYLDAMVQFHASDTTPVKDGRIDDGEKAIVWLRAKDGQTNLVVTAGYLKAAGAVEAKDYVVTNLTDVREDTWYRLTIKLLPDMTETGARAVGLIVYLDGREAFYSSSESFGEDRSVTDHLNTVARSHAHPKDFPGGCGLFPSYDRNSVTVSAIGFEGLGAVDDVYFKDGYPAGGFGRDPIVFTLKWTAGVSSFDYLFNGETDHVEARGMAGEVDIDVSTGGDFLEITRVNYSAEQAEGIWLDTYDEQLEVDPARPGFRVALYNHGTIVSAPAVFKCGTKYYGSFAKLLDDGFEGVVELVRDLVWDDEYVSAIELGSDFWGYGPEIVLDLKGRRIESTYDLLSVLYVKAGHLTVRDTVGGGTIRGGWSDMLVDLQYDGRLTLGDPSVSGDHPVTYEGLVYIEPLSYDGPFSGELSVVRGIFANDGGEGRAVITNNLAPGSAVIAETSRYLTVAPQASQIAAPVTFTRETLTQAALSSFRSGSSFAFAETPTVDAESNTIALGDTCVSVAGYYDILPVAGRTNTFVLQLNEAALPDVESPAVDARCFTLPVSNTRPGLWYAVSRKDALDDPWSEPVLWTMSERGETIVFELDRETDGQFYTVRVTDKDPR